ncbi:hypothetical protein B5M09_008055 [Aphanomyces astaci]|uniref:Myosin motor domain-containing protein n=1 Tax=Aphanomyces astaci TaxID=112090 RepID=A0A425DBF9_APHAT|nr:hypothetical protein B5M09_008055 [Aphanomyces astaci]
MNPSVNNDCWETVVSKFKTQLAGLMADIAATQVHYVRCIKPNAVKSSSAFDFRDVADQLRCAGVVEAIRISRAAFPNKLSHERFLHRFELLQNAKIKAVNVVTVGAACAQLATALIGQPESPTSFVLGSLHIFFAAGVLLCRRWFLRQRTAAVLIQARFRQYTTTTKFQQTRRRVTRLQALWRGRASRRSLATRQFTLSVVLVQRNYRKYIAKKEYIKFRQAVILLQAQAKQRTQQAKFHAHKRELRAQQTMEMDIVALKTRLDEEKRRALDEHKQQGAMGISLLPTTKQILPPPPPPPSAGMFSAGLSVDDVSLLDESGRMLETLQREVQKWRDVHDRDISEMDQLKNENKRIKDAYTAAGASFAALNQHNKQQSKANLRLMSTHAALIKSQEEKMKKYQRQVADLKDELKLVKGSNGRGPMPGTSIDQQKRPSSNLHSNGSTADNLRGSGVLPKEDGGQLLSNNSIYYEEDANRKSGLGGMLKKMFKKNDN